ncbi:MAG: tetratricopeptide repeat protein, partial [Bacteroidia bacterium]|nr:tetratricopeptide repeat protein [Bacteroidia bacterium]
MAFLVGLTYLWGQALPPYWGAELFRSRAELAHFHGAQSWGRQEDILHATRLPGLTLSAPPSPLPALWEKYALFDLLRENTAYELEAYALSQFPSYRSSLSRFYAGKYAFLRRKYKEALECFTGIGPENLPLRLREEIQFMEGYAAYATGDRPRAIIRLRPLTEKVGPFHDAANYYLGVLYYERGDWKSAADHLEEVQVRPPYTQEAPIWLAYALSQIPDLPRLSEWAEKWLVQEPAHGDKLWPFLVITFAKARQCEKAERFSEKAPLDRLALLWRGWCAYQDQKDSIALRLWE